nr:hypothetical protein [Tanacetum cinerariifolium]
LAVLQLAGQSLSPRPAVWWQLVASGCLGPGWFGRGLLAPPVPALGTLGPECASGKCQPVPYSVRRPQPEKFECWLPG